MSAHDMHQMPAASGEHGGGMAHDMSDPAMAATMEADIRRRFWVALALTIAIVLISPMGEMIGLHLPIAPSLRSWLLLGLTTPVVFWCGWMFLSGAASALRRWRLDMSVLIAVGVLAAYLASVYLTLIGSAELFYEAAAMLVCFVLFGHWMEMKARRGTSDAMRALFDLVPSEARVLRDGKEIVVPTAQLVKDDMVVLRAGDRVPVDGELVEGTTSVDESLITGESQPVKKAVGDALVAGSVNGAGSVRFRATGVGEETTLARIAALVRTAQASRAPGQRLADRAAAYLVILAVGAGVVTFLAWYVWADATFLVALTFAISAVVIACPDALGLATPTAVAVGTAVGAKHQILIKDATTLEGAAKITTVVFDKTGTLTIGKPSVTDLSVATGENETEALRLMGAVERQSSHPLALALVAEADRRGAPVADATDVQNVAGHGLIATVEGHRVLVCNAKLMEREQVPLGPIQEPLDRLLATGRTVVLLAVDGRAVAVVGVSDPIKPSAKRAVAELRSRDIRTVLLSGDNQQVAEAVGREVGVDQVIAEVLPVDKSAHVKALQAKGQFVAMVGDGVNDAPALAQADIGIAIGAGTDVAIEAAKIVLMRSDPLDVTNAIILSKATVRKMKQNLVWASVYNLLAIPVAAGAFYSSFGISLRPEVSALLMSVSSIIVAVNAVMLRRASGSLLKG